MSKEYGVQNNGGWIPCSERMPEDGTGAVLCCDKYGEYIVGYPFEEDGKYNAESGHEYMYDCVAWMQLPEAYKGDE